MSSKVSTAERFWRQVEFTDTCWLWTGYPTRKGYGLFRTSPAAKVPAHRWAYEFCIGRIPIGLTLDHLCRIRACVRPDHLEPVTNRENILRGAGNAAVNARKTHCDRGHALTPANLYIYKDGRERVCRQCHAMRTKAYSSRKAERSRAVL